MSILTDIRSAAQSYAADFITTSITNLVADVPNAISPNEQFSFDIIASNAADGTATGDPDGIAVVNVRYQLSVKGADVQLIVPDETVAIARSGADETSSQLTPGTLVDKMYLFPITPDGIALGINDGDAIRGLKGQAGPGTGVGEISVRVHVDPDINALFPGDIKSSSGALTIDVV